MTISCSFSPMIIFNMITTVTTYTTGIYWSYLLTLTTIVFRKDHDDDDGDGDDFNDDNNNYYH